MDRQSSTRAGGTFPTGWNFVMTRSASVSMRIRVPQAQETRSWRDAYRSARRADNSASGLRFPGSLHDVAARLSLAISVKCVARSDGPAGRPPCAVDHRARSVATLGRSPRSVGRRARSVGHGRPRYFYLFIYLFIYLFFFFFFII